MSEHTLDHGAAVGFTFSDDKDATLSDASRRAVMVLHDIEATMKHGEIGEGTVLPGGDVRVEFQAFILVMGTDGTFHGIRKDKRNHVSQA